MGVATESNGFVLLQHVYQNQKRDNAKVTILIHRGVICSVPAKSYISNIHAIVKKTVKVGRKAPETVGGFNLIQLYLYLAKAVVLLTKMYDVVVLVIFLPDASAFLTFAT